MERPSLQEVDERIEAFVSAREVGDRADAFVWLVRSLRPFAEAAGAPSSPSFLPLAPTTSGSAAAAASPSTGAATTSSAAGATTAATATCASVMIS